MLYCEEFKIRTNDLKFDNQITPKAILDFFQVVAGEHANLLGLGYQELLKKNLTWVLAKTRVTIKKSPDLFSNISIKTWPLERGKIDFIRNYVINDQNGDTLLYGASQWCLIDITSRRIVKALDITYPDTCLSEKVYEDKIPAISPDFSNFLFIYKVNISDIDCNMHMNNSKYGDLILNALTLEENIKEFQINYLNEALLNEEISVYKTYEDGYIKISGKSIDKSIFVAKVIL